MKYLIMLHIIYYKLNSVLYNCIKYISIYLEDICPVFSFCLCPDWKVCIITIALVCISCLGAMLNGCVSPHLSDTQSKYTVYITIIVFCTYVSYYWYKCRCTIHNKCASPCWFSRPNVCVVDSLCPYRCVSPCGHSTNCIYVNYCTSILCCMCVIYNQYNLCLIRWCTTLCLCVWPSRCGTPCGYCLSRRTP